MTVSPIRSTIKKTARTSLLRKGSEELKDPHMRKQSTILAVMSVVVLLTTSSLALYFRSQAVFFQREYSAAVARLGQMTAAPVTPEPAAPQWEVTKTPAAPRDADADNRPPPRREPEPQVAEKVTPAPIAAVTIPLRSSESDRFRRRSSDSMENHQTNDPPRYTEFQQRRQAMQQDMQNAWGQATNYFMNRDISKMTQTDLEEYSTMITLLNQAASLNQQLQSGLPSDMRHQVSADLRSNIVAVTPLLVNERNREYYDAAVAMGQNEQDAAALVSYINQITSNTSLRAIISNIRMGGRHGGGPSFAP